MISLTSFPMRISHKNARKVFLKVALFLLIFILALFEYIKQYELDSISQCSGRSRAKSRHRKGRRRGKNCKHAETKIAKADAETKIVKTNAEAKVAIINADAEKKIAKAEADQKMAEMAFEIQIITMHLENSVVKESQYNTSILLFHRTNRTKINTRRDKLTSLFTTDSRGQAAYSCIVRANPIWSKGEQNIAERLTSFKVMHTMRLPMISIADNFRSEKRSNDGAAL